MLMTGTASLECGSYAAAGAGSGLPVDERFDAGTELWAMASAADMRRSSWRPISASIYSPGDCGRPEWSALKSDYSKGEYQRADGTLISYEAREVDDLAAEERGGCDRGGRGDRGPKTVQSPNLAGSLVEFLAVGERR